MTEASSELQIPDRQYVRFPPKWRLVLVPTVPRSAAMLGMTMYTASKSAPLAAQRLLWHAVRVFGPRILPGERETWSPPMPTEPFLQICAQVGATLGRPIDAVAVYERPQSDRAALTMLACAGRDARLVRVRRDASSLTLERRVSAAYRSDPVPSFRVPTSVGIGAVAGWHWVAYELMATRPHSPVRRAGPNLFQDVTHLVERVLERPATVPPHWRGAHGDVTPWNLRRSSTHTWLIDWEDSCWAPPHADRVYFSAIVRATRPGPVRTIAIPGPLSEAAAHWRERVDARPAGGSDGRLRRRLLRALGVP